MTEPGSRYHDVPTAELTVRAGGTPRQIRYLRRRFLPPLDGMVVIAEHRVSEGDRIDTLSARYLGDPLAYWRIADANQVLQPETLTGEPGCFIRIAMPRP
ncbi:hypothetical protein BH23GEM10_BH23GEM10_00150 [soil metagenome]